MPGQSQSTIFREPPAPLAERVRPGDLDGFVGQERLLGEDGVLRRLIERDRLPSMIFWGGPGTGKTTLARIIANRTQGNLMQLSAVSSGVGDVRKVIQQAAANRSLGKRTFLFIDEIHRFNKAQQDALLHAVEDGTVILIGATTENPSFEVISPLLSRCRVFRFEMLSQEEVGGLIDRALRADEILHRLEVKLDVKAREALLAHAGGDGRAALTALELGIEIAQSEGAQPPVRITTAHLESALQARPGQYDKKGDFHYDVISAFIKSLRGSDPDAAVYWLARMIDAGEDPRFIARRMVILAAEDVGNANPTALVLAQACADAVHFIGMPEGRIPLAQTAVYLASSPKSNASYVAVEEAMEDVLAHPERPVPLHLRNPVTGLMKGQGYGKGYRYAHDNDGGFTEQQHLPDGLQNRIYYRPTDRGSEKAIAERLKAWWKKRRTR